MFTEAGIIWESQRRQSVQSMLNVVHATAQARHQNLPWLFRVFKKPPAPLRLDSHGNLKPGWEGTYNYGWWNGAFNGQIQAIVEPVIEIEKIPAAPEVTKQVDNTKIDFVYDDHERKSEVQPLVNEVRKPVEVQSKSKFQQWIAGVKEKLVRHKERNPELNAILSAEMSSLRSSDYLDKVEAIVPDSDQEREAGKELSACLHSVGMRSGMSGEDDNLVQDLQVTFGITGSPPTYAELIRQRAQNAGRLERVIKYTKIIAGEGRENGMKGGLLRTYFDTYFPGICNPKGKAFNKAAFNARQDIIGMYNEGDLDGAIAAIKAFESEYAFGRMHRVGHQADASAPLVRHLKLLKNARQGVDLEAPGNDEEGLDYEFLPEELLLDDNNVSAVTQLAQINWIAKKIAIEKKLNPEDPPSHIILVGCALNAIEAKQGLEEAMKKFGLNVEAYVNQSKHTFDIQALKNDVSEIQVGVAEHGDEFVDEWKLRREMRDLGLEEAADGILGVVGANGVRELHDEALDLNSNATLEAQRDYMIAKAYIAECGAEPGDEFSRDMQQLAELSARSGDLSVPEVRQFQDIKMKYVDTEHASVISKLSVPKMAPEAAVEVKAGEGDLMSRRKQKKNRTKLTVVGDDLKAKYRQGDRGQVSQRPGVRPSTGRQRRNSAQGIEMTKSHQRRGGHSRS